MYQQHAPVVKLTLAAGSFTSGIASPVLEAGTSRFLAIHRWPQISMTFGAVPKAQLLFVSSIAGCEQAHQALHCIERGWSSCRSIARGALCKSCSRSHQIPLNARQTDVVV